MRIEHLSILTAPAPFQGRPLALSALLFAALLLVSVGNALAQGSAATDREALVELYDATDGANWKVIRNWKTTAPIEKWYGVRINYARAGRVVNLDLYGNRLSGAIPASLGNLIRLTELDLYGNRLSGTIPATLDNLIDLDYLSLDTDTGLCLAHDFPLTSMFARLAQAHTPPIAVCNGDTPDGPMAEVFTLDFGTVKLTGSRGIKPPYRVFRRGLTNHILGLSQLVMR